MAESLKADPISLRGVNEGETTRYSNVRFESGIHPLADSEWAQILANYNSGDLGQHYWNLEVKRRISPVSILAIDGIAPGSPAEWKWLALPGRPRELNPSGEVYTIGADLQNMTVIGNDEIDIRKEVQVTIQQMKNEASTTLLAGAIISAGGATLSSYNLEQRKRLSPKNYSRRSFISLGLSATGVALIGKGIGQGLVAYDSSVSTSKADEDILLTVAEFVKPRFSNYNWVNARTAILLSKITDSMNRLGLTHDTSAAVVMGNAHSFEAKNYMNSSNSRKNAIYDFGNDLIATLNALADAKYPNINRRQAVNQLLDSLALTEISRMRDPQVPSPNADFPGQVDRFVTTVDSFLSPQVLDALAPLRP